MLQWAAPTFQASALHNSAHGRVSMPPPSQWGHRPCWVDGGLAEQGDDQLLGRDQDGYEADAGE
ncbi:hypothetical protein GCM10027562_28780 [Arthrobacter pigmenti]